jgi:hypothetical protein
VHPVWASAFAYDGDTTTTTPASFELPDMLHCTVPISPDGHGTTSMKNDRGGSAWPTTILIESAPGTEDSDDNTDASGTGLRSQSRMRIFKLYCNCGEGVGLGTNVDVDEAIAIGVTDCESTGVATGGAVNFEVPVMPGNVRVVKALVWIEPFVCDAVSAAVSDSEEASLTVSLLVDVAVME